jgi:hypothetical protein
MENAPKKEMSLEEVYDWTVKDTAELEAQKAEAEKAGDTERAKKIGAWINTDKLQQKHLSEELGNNEEKADVTASLSDVAGDKAKSAHEQYEDELWAKRQEIEADRDRFTKI